MVPVVTPFRDDYSLDSRAAEQIARYLTDGGVRMFLSGTTGEGPSLTPEQKLELAEATVRVVAGRQPVMAGIPGNSFVAAVEEGKMLADKGIDALVATMPNYFPIDDQLILLYFEKLADALPLPLFLYNMPLTIHRSLPLDVIEMLSYHSNIIGLKDSEKNAERLDEALRKWSVREDFIYLVGNAASSVEGLRKGAAGIVPGTGNVCPRLYRDLFDAAGAGDFERAERLLEITVRITGLYQGNRSLSHALAALKVMMNRLGLCGTQVMPPLVRMEEAEAALLRDETDRIAHLWKEGL